MVFLYISLGVLALLFALYIFLVAPSGRRKKTAEFFSGQSKYAHRGLHGGEVPENSLAAFELACRAGYGIELDVHVTADNQLVVFHDDTLTRMCGVDEKTESKTLAELQALTLGGTGEHIPSFREVLDLIDGRAPLIVEIKGTSMSNMRVCELTAQMLDGYGGKYCIEAFNPLYVRWWKKNRKSIVRGQLSNKMKKEDSGQPPFVNFLLENMLLSFLARPDFLAYCAGNRKQPSFRFARALGGYPVAWTIRTQEDLETVKTGFKAIIFENVRP
ncbi:MAG: glycerophosphodiester phosphodiesterase [Clostridia bacterium]|nr:glycerophosphodiester phosphodiesterase [Clostridia bacterium]